MCEEADWALLVPSANSLSCPPQPLGPQGSEVVYLECLRGSLSHFKTVLFTIYIYQLTVYV